MSQKRKKQKAQKKPALTHTHSAGTSGVGKKTYIAEVLKSTRESGQQLRRVGSAWRHAPNGTQIVFAATAEAEAFCKEEGVTA
jgi:hypothetical protein